MTRQRTFSAFLIAIFLVPSLALASDIVDQTVTYVKRDLGVGIAAAYDLDGANAKPSGTTVTEDIQGVLKHLGYPENTWPAIEKEVIALLARIDLPRLKKEALQARPDPLKLKDFVTKLGGLIEQDGYLKEHPSHPLIKLLTTSFVDDDISQVILTSPTSFLQKVESKKALVACTAISQFGSILLHLLDINVKVVFSPAHVFNCIPLDDKRVLFVDFSNQVFEIVDIKQYYYNLGTRTKLLKDEYHISPQRLLEIKGQMASELQSDTLQELLCYLYLYIYISDDYATTPAIFLNLANIHSLKGDYTEAISYYNKAIDLEPEYADAYHGRGVTDGNKGDLDQAIADLSKAIELFPDFAEAYHDLANVYKSKGDSDKAIFELDQALIIDPNYTQAYRDRGTIYAGKGNFDQAITDYDKAIEIDPYFSDAYKSRAEAYFSKGEYDRARKDIHQVEDFGDEVSPDLLEKLKTAGDSKNFFMALIIAPILILSVFLFF